MAVTPLTKEGNNTQTQDIEKEISDAYSQLEQARGEIARVFYGQETVVQQVITTLIAGGHGFIVGVPGLGKTHLVESIATVFGLDRKRVQCTPDLMPSDILGTEVLEDSTNGKRDFRFVKGPVFSQLLMADEINRASPRTQSALLQAMQEYEVTVAGQTYALPEPFHVLATQNPVEQEGTYRLPEAQLDRFLMQVNIDYPSQQAEQDILLNTTSIDRLTSEQILSSDDVVRIQQLVRIIPIGQSVVDATLYLIRQSRPELTQRDEIKKYLNWGPGPRAGQALILAARAQALLDGRLSPSVEDIVSLAKPILRHRLGLNFEARADHQTADHIIEKLCDSL